MSPSIPPSRGETGSSLHTAGTGCSDFESDPRSDYSLSSCLLTKGMTSPLDSSVGFVSGLFKEGH